MNETKLGDMKSADKREAHFSSAFIFADDLQRVLPSSGSLYALSDHSKVSIP